MSEDNIFVELQGEFITEALFLMEQFEESMLALESSDNLTEHLAVIFRVAHSIKGGGAAVGFDDLGRFAHSVEDLLAIIRMDPDLITPEIVSLLLKSGDAFKTRLTELKLPNPPPWNIENLHTEVKNTVAGLQGQANSAKEEPEAKDTKPTSDPAEDPAQAPPDETQQALAPSTKSGTGKQSFTIKVDLNRVDSVLDNVGELVVLKNQILHCEELRNSRDGHLGLLVDQVDKTVRELYERVLSLRLTPLKSMFLKLQRITRDLSQKLDKPIELQLIGEDTEVERTAFEFLGDPLIHMLRNSIDHGLESPEARTAAGKDATGHITITAAMSGGNVLIEIKDDGRGISRDKILEKAKAKGMIGSNENADALSNEQVYDFLFRPGFSTAETVTDLSGRGVGLDVAKSNIEKIGGHIRIHSTLGKGASFQISIPMNTAITDGIEVKIHQDHFVLPTSCIKEIVQLDHSKITQMSRSKKVIRMREEVIPVYDIQLFSPHFSTDDDQQLYCLVEASKHKFAMPVSAVLGQTQVVVKPLPFARKMPEVSGAAVMGDGKTVLILDPNGLSTQFDGNSESAA